MTHNFRTCFFIHVLLYSCTAAPPGATDATTELWPPEQHTTAPVASTSTSLAPTTTLTPTTGEPAHECGDQPGDPVELALGGFASCARRGCALQCWGSDLLRQLGHGRRSPVCNECEAPDCCLGDDEHPADWGDVDVGEPIARVAAASTHTCVVFLDGRARCWGDNDLGQLGLGHPIDTPLGSPAAARPDVKLDVAVVDIAAAAWHTCAITVDGGVRCWGSGADGRLGRGDTEDIGDDELPSVAGDLDLGGEAVAIAAADDHTCAILAGGRLRCWGDNRHGQLGYGHTDPIGDDETPASAGDVPVGAPVIGAGVYDERTCVVTETGGVRCWGRWALGYATPGVPCACNEGAHCCLGDDETPDTRGDIDLGGPAIQVAVGRRNTCAVLADGSVRCWGPGAHGLLGPDVHDAACGDDCSSGAHCCLGDDEPPTAAPPLQLGEPARSVAVSARHACAVLQSGAIRCWGSNIFGALGLGLSPEECNDCGSPTCCIGDDEAIDTVMEVRAFTP